MTREELREKVVFHYEQNRGAYPDLLDAAIALVLEEAARVGDNKQAAKDDDGDGWSSGWIAACEEIAAAIRALKGDNNGD